jgi:hypothetical protein
MPRRPEPASASMSEFIDEYSLNKSQRQELLEVILGLHKKYPIKPNHVRMLAKSRLRERGIVPVTKAEMELLENEAQVLTNELATIEGELPKLLILKGVDIDGEYVDVNDHELCRKFFKQIEQAIENYKQDRDFDSSRPNKSQIVERLRLLKHACEPLSKELRDIDDYTRAFVEEELHLDVDIIVDQVANLASGYELSKAIDAGKKNTAALNLCVAAIKALQGVGLSTTTSREGLLEKFVQKIFFVVNKTEVPQIQKTIRVALTMFN